MKVLIEQKINNDDKKSGRMVEGTGVFIILPLVT
jgi:hypothetical protein